MKTLIVEQAGSELRYQNSYLTVYCEGKRTHNVAVKQLERVIVSPQVTLTAGVLGVVAEQNVPLMVLNARLPHRTATLSGHHSGNVRRRLGQYHAAEDTEFCMPLATRLVLLKIRRQHGLLGYALQVRPELRHSLVKANQQLNTAINQLAAATVYDIATLNGLEGAAAMVYFQAYTQLFCSSLQFTGRNRRPPKDPVNAALSLAYTLLQHEAANALKIYGLDPAVGFYHQLHYGRDSLACDLIEPLRPYVDRWLWRMFAEQVLRSSHFVYEETACCLTNTGKPIFYQHFYVAIKPLKRLLRRYALNVANQLQSVISDG